MADPKFSPKPSEASKLFHKDHHKEVFYLIAVLLFIGLIIQQATFYINYLGFSSFASFWDSIVLWVLGFWPLWRLIALIIVITSIVWSIYSFRKLREIEHAEEKIFGKVDEGALLTEGAVPQKSDKYTEKWEKVLEHTHSDNPADWRLAIIEADVMLEDLLKALGYHGDGVGELLKAVEPEDMLTLDNALEAHKVRNRIAHSGSDFELNERETKRIISLFESSFREFQFI